MGAVWVAGPWRVESVRLDRGTGLRDWIELSRGTERVYCTGAAALYEHLHRHGLDFDDLTPADAAPVLRDPRDGCE